MDEFELYESGMSIPEVSEETGMPKSTLRFRFKKKGILRNRADGVRLAGGKGKLGSGLRGKKRTFSDEWKSNISKSKLGVGEGVSIKPSGYIEITMGEHKGKMQHVLVMEESIGRKLHKDECVHHKDRNKQNNRIDNLMLMTKSDHSKLHAIEDEAHKNRERDNLGRFK